MTLLKWLTFLLESLTVTLTVLISGIISSDASIVLQWLSLSFSVSIYFLSNPKGDARFIAYTFIL